MEKSLVALATLSVVGTAFADVDVSGGIKLYGVLDQAVTNQTLQVPTSASGTTPISYTGMFASSATSRLGVRGSRDLGDGMKGRIQVEIQVEPDNATNLPAANRGTFVGISKAEAGEIILGTQETTAYEVFGMDVNGRVEYKPQVWRYTASQSGQDRSNNTVKYITPEIGGFTGHFSKGWHSETGSTSAGASFISYGIKYKQDKLQAAYVFDKYTNSQAAYRLPGLINAGPSKEGASQSTTLAYGGTSAATTDVLRNIAAVTYDFGSFAVNYIYAKSYTTRSTSPGSLSTNTLGVKVPIEKITIAASYGGGTIDSYSSTASSSVTKDAVVDDTTIGAYYNIDKSTYIYFLGSNSNYVGGNTQDGRNTTYAIGARYNF